MSSKNIYEMQQIRHVFAHKQGVADKRFVDACPHLGYRPNQPILIDRETWSDFMVNALLYTELVLTRMKKELGLGSKRPSAVIRPIRYPAVEGLDGRALRLFSDSVGLYRPFR